MLDALRDLLDCYFLQKKELKLVNFDKLPLEKLQNFAKEGEMIAQVKLQMRK